MKILAVRGENLASLKQPFELDLEAAPLNGTGLFAVTGPTGVGKSTLLDAVCLALFDCVPRFHGSGKLPNTRQRQDGIAGDDPRNVLRQGAAEGYAEVDFRGVDGRVYRSRWAVRRARGRADGKMQAQTMDLICLEDQAPLSDHRKTDTLRTISDKLGLDFQQFCRAVVLPQNAFASFLKAAAKERAHLLETITGTQVYARLSKAAFERHKQEEQALKDIAEEHGRLNLLDGEARAALAQTVADLRAEETRLAGDLETLKHTREQLRHEADRAQRLDRARADAEAAATRLKEMDADYIEAVLAAARLRPYVEAYDQQTARRDRLNKDRETAQEACDHLAGERGKAETGVTRADAVAAVAKREYDALLPQLAEARDLDRRLADARADRAEEAAALARHQAALAQQQAQQETLTREGDTLAEEADGVDAWLTAHADDGRLEPWAPWEEEVAALAAAGAARDAASGRLAGLEADAAETRAACTSADAALDGAVHTLKAAEEVAEAAEQAAAEARADDPQAALRAAMSRRTELEKVAGLVARQTTCRADLAAEQATLADLDTREAQDKAALTEAESRRGVTQVRLEEAEGALRRAEAAQDFAPRRAELLHEGEPCPLCGATEHPLRDQPAPEAPVLTAQRARVAELQATRDSLTEEVSALRTRLEAVHAGRETHTGRVDRLQAELDELTTAATHAMRALDLAEAPTADDLRDQMAALDTARADLEARCARLVAAEREAGSAAGALKTTRAAMDAARRAADQAVQAQRTAEQAWQEAQRAHADADARAARHVDRLMPWCRETWDRTRLLEAPAAFGTYLRARRDTWCAHVARKQTLVAERHRVDKEQVALTAATAGTEEKRDQARRRCDALDLDLTSWADKRAGLLGGKPTEDVAHAAEKALEDARKQVEASRAHLHDVEKQLHGRREGLRALEEEAAETEMRVRRDREALDARLVGAGLEEAALRTYLRHDDAWCRAREAALTQARAAAADTQTRVVAFEKELAELRAALPTDAEPASLAERLSAAESALETVRSDRHRRELEWETDTRNREAAQAVLPRLEAQRTRKELWAEVNDLIGSHDGTKFRKFAQSLTLDILVEGANYHMAELNPRYLLRRVVGEDLELEVLDRHMADEPRSPAALSGGETFLVSLALALGLSALHAEGTQIESLFIDEGFGALDPTALDIALAALEQLQAGGRQVGIISHVAAVAERVDCRVEVVRRGNGAGALRLAFT